ncbi:MAG TPA: hypothetical protein VIS77_07630 [Burkholderiales bacterium]
MSHESPPSAASAAPQLSLDPIQDLAQNIYVQLAARAYSTPEAAKAPPDARLIAQTSFKLAEAFVAANYEFNPTAIAARDAKAKATVNLDNVQIDFSPVGKTG